MLSSIRLFLLLSLLLILVITSHAQEWAAVKKFGIETNLGRAGLMHSVTDQAGNTYAVGHYGEKIVFNGQTYQAPGFDNNFFLIKLNKDGQVTWASFFNGISMDDTFFIDKITVDKYGRTYIYGMITYEAHFGNNVKLIMPPTLGSITHPIQFVAVYDANGVAMWAKFASAPVAVTPEGKIYTQKRLHANIKDYSWWKNYIMEYHSDSLHCYKPDGTPDRRIDGFWDYEWAETFATEGEDLWLQGNNNGLIEYRRYSYGANAFTESHLVDIKVGFDANMINHSLYFRGYFHSRQTIQVGDITLTAKDFVNGNSRSGFLVKYDMTSKSYSWGKIIWGMENGPTFVAENGKGDVHLAFEEVGLYADNNISAYSASGDSLWTKVSLSYLLRCNGMGTDQNGNVYIVGDASNGQGMTAQFPPLSFTYSWAVGYWAKINLGNYPVPSAPVNLTTSGITTSTVSLTWQHNSNDETGYRIEYKSGSGTYQQLKELPANSFSYVATNLNCNTAYDFRIIALGQGNSSAPSTIASATTQKIPAPVIESSATSGCEGDMITLTAPSGFAKTYWSTGATTEEITISSGGQFKLVVEDEKHCKSDTAKLTLEYYPYPVATLVSDHTSISTLETSGNFQWYRNDAPLAGETSSTITPTESGFYSVSVSNHGCSTLSEELEFIVTGIELPSSKVIEVFPVPAREAVTIRFNNAGYDLAAVELISMKGQKIEAQIKVADAKELWIDTSVLVPGIYLLRIKRNAAAATFKIAVE
jgi:hypothetical protein